VTKPDRYITGKHDSRVWDGLHVGYEGESGAYRIYVPLLRRVFVSRDVTFIEKLIHAVPVDKEGTVDFLRTVMRNMNRHLHARRRSSVKKLPQRGLLQQIGLGEIYESP